MKTSNSIVVQRSLTSNTLLRSLTQSVFVPSRIAPEDDFQMGWRILSPSSALLLSFERLESATSEGVNALGVLCEALNFGRTSGLIELKFDRQSRELAEVIGLDVLSRKAKFLGLQPLRRRLVDSFSTGACMVELTDPQSALLLAQQIVHFSAQVIGKVSPGKLEDFGGIVERVATEGLLNVYEHAFAGSSARRRVFVCATIARPEQTLRSESNEMHDVEKRWLAKFQGRYVFELAISDAGFGIPRTLWRDAIRRRPDLFKRLENISSGTDRYRTARAEIHSELCFDAFHHESTCKQLTDFNDLYHGLNWRGLYRGRQPVESYEGFIALSSGKGRAGYASNEDLTEEFVYQLAHDSDLPGTTLTVRLPLPLKRAYSRRLPSPSFVDSAQPPLLLTPRLLRWKELTESTEAGKLSPIIGQGKIEVPFIGIVFPFFKVTSENLPPPKPTAIIPAAQLMRELRALPPDIVPILFNLELADEELSVLARDWEEWTIGHGHPRLLAVWQTQSKRLIWRIAGVFPPTAKHMLRDLEDNGVSTLTDDSSPECFTLAQGLATNYPHFVTFDAERRTVRLGFFAVRVSPKSVEQAFEVAFASHWARTDVKERVITDDPDRPVRVHTGRLVRRYLCVLFLVESSPMLASLLGRNLLDAIEEFSSEPRSCTLVVDDYGSAFVAQRLLSDVENQLHILGWQDAKRLPHGSEVVLFVDAIFRGQTVRTLVRSLRESGSRIVGVVTCVDLRIASDDIVGVTIKSLVRITDFNAEELSREVVPDEIQIDRLTHVPVIADASDFLEIATTTEARKLLKPGVFDHGFHERGGRLHTISLPVSKLMRSAKDDVLDCLIKKLTTFLLRYVGGSTDVVFFYRAESEIGKQVGNLYERLVAMGLVHPHRVFLRAIPTAHRGARSIFSHIAIDVFAECRPIEQQLSMFTDRKLDEDFVAVYLDDAAVTGRALRSFLFRAMRNPKRVPRAIQALIIVNRLSPGEVRIFSLCQNLETQEASKQGVPFHLDSLLRLQVFSREDSFRDHALLRRIRQSGWVPNQTLRQYLEALISKLSATPKEPVRHIFLAQSEDKAAPLSPDVAQLRHLLALHQQNEGVVADVLRIFTRIEKHRDRTLLNLLALEPELLDEPPLSGICRRAIVDLSVETIRSQTPLEDKSDALTVLAWYETAFFDRLSDFVSDVLRHESLRKQLSLFLLTLFSRTEIHYNKWLDALDSVSESEAKEWAAWAREIVIQANWFQQTVGAVRTNEDAETRLRRLIARMSRHSEASEEHWESLSNQLRPMRSDWAKYAHPKAQENVFNNVRNARDLVETVFIPGLAALIYCAHANGDDETARQLREAHERVLELCARFKLLIPRDLGDVTRELVATLFETLEELRKVTWSGGLSSSDVLSRTELGSPSAPLWALGRFYCAPWIILRKMVNETLSIADIPAVDAFVEEASVVVCRIPVDVMRQILRPLLQNVVSHGDLSSLTVDKHQSQDARKLVLEIRNRTTKPGGGDGVGLMIAREQGRRFKVDIKAEPQGDMWLTEVHIPDFFAEDLIRRPRR